MTRVQVHLLGPVHVVVGGRDVVRYRPEQQALVARLALDAGTPVPATSLAVAAWPDGWPARGALEAARRIDGDMRVLELVVRRADRASLRLERHPDGAWTLHLDPDVLDLARFRAARDEGLTALGRHDVMQSIQALTAAVDEFRRPALEDLSTPWAKQTRQYLELEALEAHAVLADLARRHLPGGDARAEALHARFVPQSPALWAELVRAWTKDFDAGVLAALVREAGRALGRRLQDETVAAGLHQALDAARAALAGTVDGADVGGALPLDVRLFGRFRVLRGGADVTPPSDRHTAVLAALVVRRGAGLSWAEIERAGWPDGVPAAPLEAAVAAASAALEAPDATGTRARVRRTGTGAVVELPVGWTDADRVEALRAAATDRLTSGRADEALPLLRSAVAASTAPPLDGLAGPVFDDARRRLDDLARAVAEQLATALVEDVLDTAGRPTNALLDELGSLVATHPGSVVLRERLMTAYDLAGRPDDALTAHDAARRDLGPALVGRAADLMADLRTRIEARRAAPVGSAVRFEVLAGPRLTVFGRPAPLRNRARQHALAALLLRRRAVLSVDDLASAVWGRPPVDPAASTTRLVQEVLDAVDAATRPIWGTPKDDEAAARRSPLAVRAVPGGWAVDLPAEALDLDEVVALADRGLAAWRAGDAPTAADALRAVLRRVPERPLGDLDGEWFTAERDRLAAWRASLVGPCLRAELACGRPDDALPDLERMAADRPADEDLAAELIDALHAAGRTADALVAYDRCAAELRRTLGAAPGPTLQMQRRRIAGEDAGGGR